MKTVTYTIAILLVAGLTFAATPAKAESGYIDNQSPTVVLAGFGYRHYGFHGGHRFGHHRTFGHRRGFRRGFRGRGFRRGFRGRGFNRGFRGRGFRGGFRGGRRGFRR